MVWAFILCNIIPSFHALWFSRSSGFAALFTALFAKFEVALFTCENCFSGFAAQFAWLLATRLLTQLSDEHAAFVSVLHVESHPISAHKQTELPSQHAGPEVFESIKRFLSHPLTT